ncbi:MAG: hypothetical protein HY884_05015 [Deltaproteobacteria bacterium]|nr:hypothetical protein [Deltaproteobacteria bacterium]
MVFESSKKIVIGGLRLGAAMVLAAGVMTATAYAAPPASAPAVVAPAAPAGPVETGNASIGEMLFKGERRFANGGPPCMSCHSASTGSLEGGVLGPNLTKTYADETKNGLLSTMWVNQPSIPVMGPVFSAKNITDDEMGNLRAFFERQSKGAVAASAGGTFTIIGILGGIGILIIFSLIWSGRYSKRAGNTAHDALWRNYGGKGGR